MGEEIGRLYNALLSYKLYYYHPELVHDDWVGDLSITDAKYDALESEYKALTNTDIPVGFPSHTMQGKILIHKYSMCKVQFQKFIDNYKI